MERELKSLAACVGYATGGEEPPHESDLRLRQWLSGRNLGLISSEPHDGFTWPGHFFARLRSDGMWTVLFGAPPGVVFVPGGDVFTFDSLTATFDSFAFLVPYELPDLAQNAAPAFGTVRHLTLADAAEAPMREVERAEAIAGRGLRGDRYEKMAGTFTTPGGRGNDLTLIEVEALEELRGIGVKLPVTETRRNVLTGGIELDALIGRRFRIGDVECFGQRRCEPCAHLEHLTRPGVLRGLVHRGGLRADVLTDGIINVGDRIEAL